MAISILEPDPSPPEPFGSRIHRTLLGIARHWKEILVWTPAVVIVACTALLDGAGNRRAGGAFFLYLAVLALAPPIVRAFGGLPAEDVNSDAPKWVEHAKRAAFVVFGLSASASLLIAAFDNVWTSRRLPGLALAICLALMAVEALYATARKLGGKQAEQDHLQSWMGIASTVLISVGAATAVIFGIVLRD